VPADNNLAERDLRPSVIGRKVSFGSVTDNGAKTRSTLTTLLTTVKKQAGEPVARIKDVPDQMAKDMKQDPYPLVFPTTNPEKPST
jgi:transposase